MSGNQHLSDFFLVLLGISSAMNFTMGGLVLRRFPRSVLHLTYSFMTFFLGIWNLLNFLWILSVDYQSLFLDRATFACLPIVNFLFLMFAALSPRHGKQKIQPWMIVMFCIMLGSVVVSLFTPLVLSSIQKGGWGQESVFGPLFWPFAWFWVTTFFSGIVVFHLKLKYATDPFDRIRLKFLVFGAWIPFVLGPPVYMIPYAFGLGGVAEYVPILLPTVSSLSMIVNAYAIMRFQLLDVRLASRNAVISILHSIFIAFIAALLGKEFLSPEISLTSTRFIAFFIVTFSFALFNTYVNMLISKAVSRVLFPGVKSQQEAVYRFSLRVPGMRGLNELSREVCVFLREFFLATGSVIYMHDPAAGKYMRMVASDPSDFKIAPDDGISDRLVLYSEMSSEPVTRYEIEVQGERHLLFPVLSFFMEKGVEIYIPLSSAGRCVGGIFVTYRAKGSFYNVENLNVMRQFAEVIVPPLMNALHDERIAESHRRYSELFERAGDGILIISDEDGLVRETNRRAEELFRIPNGGIVGMKLGDLAVEGQAVGLLKYVETTNSGGRQIVEFSFKRGDSTAFPAEVHSVALESGVSVVIVRDLSERKVLEEELLKMKKIESLGILAGGIAHDFNNILTAIMSCVSYAGMLCGDNETAKILEKAEKACNEAKGLTRQLLTFSKGGAPVLKAASIGDVLTETAVFTLRGTNVRCETIVPDDLWPVEMDEGQISQVVQNLVLNAAQAMSNGGSIGVKAENVVLESQLGVPLPDGKYVKVAVSDAGCGVEPENLAKIFDPYFTTKPKGSGLGLAISFSVIKKHSGHIVAESTPGKGSVFSFFLPVSDSAPARSRIGKPGICRGSGRILIMDDNDMVRELLQELLESIGYRVRATADGAEAVAAYGEAIQYGDPFAAVILDLTVPGGTGGKEAVLRIRELDPCVKAIVSSGYFSDPVMAEFRSHGFDAVICKPFGVEDVSSALHSLLNENS